MRKLVVAAVGCVALAATTPALSQPGGGGGGPPGGVPGGPGGGPGGPPITPPGMATGGGPGTADIARGLGEHRGSFGYGRSLAEQQQARALERVAEYRARAEARKAEALAMAAAARAGHPIAADAETIRNALRQDMEAWRNAFRISRNDFHAERQRWLELRGTMSARDWALLRAQWFAARDAWISQHLGFAQARGQ